MSYIVREYTNDDSFTKLTAIPSWVGEIQVALAFARDYDGDKSTNGKFRPYWDTDQVTSSVISQFKKAALPLKVNVLVSIGDRNAKYRFAVAAGEKDSWISNATESLTSIIKQYNLDGIDVYYEHIESGQDVFVDCIGKLITNLKENGAISVASIAPTAPLNANFYFPLYKDYSDKIDTVVYQCFTEVKPVKSIESLVEIFNNIVNNFYPKEKLLAGYSTISKDWATVSPPLYFFAVSLLLITGTLAGTAIWVISDSSARGAISASVTSFPPEWILELVSLALNEPGKLHAFLPK